MNCQRCADYALTRVADIGGMVLVRCTSCGHQQLVRAQEPRGTHEERPGERRVVSSCSGEIVAR